MRLLFKQRFFSWFDSFDIYDESGNIYFTVEGCLSWGHMFKIYDNRGLEVAVLKERILTFLHRFEIYINGEYQGEIYKELTFFIPRFHLDMGGYDVEGSWTEWDYQILKNGRRVGTLSKQLFNLTDTYIIDAEDGEELPCLLINLAIDAVKCDEGRNYS